MRATWMSAAWYAHISIAITSIAVAVTVTVCWHLQRLHLHLPLQVRLHRLHPHLPLLLPFRRLHPHLPLRLLLRCHPHWLLHLHLLCCHHHLLLRLHRPAPPLAPPGTSTPWHLGTGSSAGHLRSWHSCSGPLWAPPGTATPGLSEHPGFGSPRHRLPPMSRGGWAVVPSVTRARCYGSRSRGVLGTLAYPRLILPYSAYNGRLSSSALWGDWCSPIPWWCN
jgi:hypothetical protein